MEWIDRIYAADAKAAHAGSVPFLELAGIVCGGWQMARAALAAQRRLEAGDGESGFCRAKITTARFFAEHLLGRTPALRAAIVEGAGSVMALGEDRF